MKTLKIAGALLAALVPAMASAQTGCKPPDGIKLVTPGQITATTSPTVPPLQYIDETGKFIGMAMELGELIAVKLCLPT